MSGVDVAVIPLAGLNTRIQPLARSIPKEMLPLGDRPVLHRVVEELIDGGVQHVVMVVGSRSESIERYFNAVPELDGALATGESRWPSGPIWSKISRCSFSFVRQDRPAGVIDAVRRAHRLVRGQRYLVHMGDSIVWRDNGLVRRMLEAHQVWGADVTIGVSWSLPHESTTRAVAEPVHEVGSRDDHFIIRRIGRAEDTDSAAPYVIGRYLIEGPMLTEAAEASGRIGPLATLLPGGDSAKVVAVPLVGAEMLMGSGTTAEYLASWEHLLNGSDS